MAETPVGPGTLLAGRFELEDLLNDTEGARFWRATDRTLARSVGVHVIPADDQRSAALLNAARTSATVTDGHLLRVLDAATENGITYVVNEWGHGISLDRLLAEGPLSPRRAAWVVKEVAEAISTAHRHGIAHGRLLPENVMVTEAGSVKLIGFVVDAVLHGRQQVRVTGGRPLAEHEADVVNLAALLYAGLTGRWAGTAGTSLPTAPTEHGRALRPRQVRAGVPRPLDAICERVLNAEAGSQHLPLETAHEIYAALCDYIGDPTGAAPVGFEATSLLDANDLALLAVEGADGNDTADSARTEDPSDAPTGELDATRAAPAVPEEDRAGAGRDSAPGWTSDPEATQVSSPPPPFAAARVRAEDAPTARTPRPQPSGDEHLFPPQPPPRPLFASDTPRPARDPEAARAPFSPRTHGPGSGTLPPVWGPDADGTGDGDPTTSSLENEDSGRSWLRIGGVLLGIVVLVVAVVVAFTLGQGTGSAPESSGTPSGSPSSTPSKPIKIVSATDFDPVGDGTENPATAPLAIDGNSSTAWRTVTYYDPLEQQKQGVGLLLDLGSSHKVSEVSVSFLGQPTSFEVLAAAQDVSSAPTGLAGLTKVGGKNDAGTHADVTLAKPVTTRYLVVWLTKLPAVGGNYVGQVSEIVVR